MATGRPESPLTVPVACVDLETTGAAAARDRIIEIGIVLLDGGEVVESWSSLVNPGVRIPPSIAEFTGIDATMVASAPTFAEIADDVRRRLDGRLFVAHNARFDYGFLRSEFRRLGERYSAPVLCTVRLSRLLCPSEPRHNLDSLIERYGLTCSARHRALGDAEVLPPLLHRLAAGTCADGFADACSSLLHEARLPSQLPAELADDLPDAPGVYVFHDEQCTPLYVGRSNNIRSRVLAHFAGAPRDNRDGRLAQSVRRVEWFETGGELGALLLERRLVRQWLPIENRRPRHGGDAFAIHLHDTPRGVRSVIEPLRGDSFDGACEVYGPFRNEQDAVKALQGKAREAELCLRVLGLESGEGSCIGYQLGRCRGACAGREPRALHDTRTRLALVRLRLKQWPFAGAVAIREPAPGGCGSVLHVLDRWRHVGTATSEVDLAELLQTRSSSGDEIDVDSYRVIGRCLERAAPRDLVTLAELGPAA